MSGIRTRRYCRELEDIFRKPKILSLRGSKILFYVNTNFHLFKERLKTFLYVNIYFSFVFSLLAK